MIDGKAVIGTRRNDGAEDHVWRDSASRLSVDCLYNRAWDNDMMGGSWAVIGIEKWHGAEEHVWQETVCLIVP